MKKRLSLLTTLVLSSPLLTSCGGPIGKQIMESGVKKFIETFDPSWRSSWYITEPLSELNSIIQGFSGFAALVGLAVSLWLVILVLRGHDLSLGAKGILLLVSVGAIAGVIPIVSILGQAKMPTDMALSKYAELMGLIEIPTSLSDATLLPASLLFAWIAPLVNKFAQMVLAIIFCFMMVTVIATASPRGFILAGSLLVGPIIVPRMFWASVTASASIFTSTGLGPIDDAVIVSRNFMTMAVFILLAAASYAGPFVFVRTFIWFDNKYHILPHEFSSLNRTENSNKSQSSSSGLGDLVTGFAGGAIASDLSDEEVQTDGNKNHRSSRRDAKSDQHEDNGSEAGTKRDREQLLLTGPKDEDDVIDAETTDVDPEGPKDDPNGSGSNPDDDWLSTDQVSHLDEEDGLHTVDEKQGLDNSDDELSSDEEQSEEPRQKSRFMMLLSSSDELHPVNEEVS